MSDRKTKLIISGIIMMTFGTFISYNFGNLLFPILNTSTSDLNETFNANNLSVTGRLAYDMFSILIYGIVLSPLGLGLGMIWLAVKTE